MIDNNDNKVSNSNNLCNDENNSFLNIGNKLSVNPNNITKINNESKVKILQKYINNECFQPKQ